MVKLTPVGLCDPEFDRLSAQVCESYPTACVLWIERVTNDALEEAFQSCRKMLVEKRGVDIVRTVRLFHGTSQNNMHAILEGGFDPSKNVRSAFGHGTYFATAAGYSKDYAQPDTDGVNYMLACDVLVGAVGNGCSQTAVHDAWVDQVSRPSVYVIPYAEAAIPRFVVAFHRDAK